MRSWKLVFLGFTALPLLGATAPRKIVWPPQHDPGPWNRPEAIIVPDPYAPNHFDFEKAFADPKIKGIILKAVGGLLVDTKVYARASEAKRRGIRFGVYLLGMSSKPWKDRKGVLQPGRDPIAQADCVVAIARATGASFIALDIEGMGGRFMAPADAAKAIARIEQRSSPHRYPLFYASKNTVKGYAKLNDSKSIFAKTQLWLAGLPGYKGNRLWPDYALLQFGAEWDCDEFLAQFPKDERPQWRAQKNCGRYTRYPVAGSFFDLDINYLNGGADRLDALFDPKPFDPLEPGELPPDKMCPATPDPTV